MNIIKSLIERIEEYRSTNKNPCKSYATEKSANVAAEKYATLIRNYFTNDASENVEYIVFYNPAWDRWCVAYNIKPLLNKFGGYVGVASNLGFFTY